MIELSTAQVSADKKETLGLLLLLLCFALAASAYVFKKGLDKADRTTHELLLKCVIIITSVVPRQLPMQTALAVNTALMALIKVRVRVRVRARPSSSLLAPTEAEELREG